MVLVSLNLDLGRTLVEFCHGSREDLPLKGLDRALASQARSYVFAFACFVVHWSYLVSSMASRLDCANLVVDGCCSPEASMASPETSLVCRDEVLLATQEFQRMCWTVLMVVLVRSVVFDSTCSKGPRKTGLVAVLVD
jgi:hypothetical protein